MISVCIPIYNFDVRILVTEIYKQIKTYEPESEIILIDDASDSDFREKNSELKSKSILIQLHENIGRAKIRNLFLQYAQNEYLLFIDCDSVISNDYFILNYTSFIKKHNPFVVCGGREYSKIKPAHKKLLRWKYGLLIESKSSDERGLNPYKSFMTNNFLIKKDVFNIVKFDERLTNYGHEDTLFGYCLYKKEIIINHIENPIVNGDIEDNDIFLKKTEDGIVNLIKISRFVELDKQFVENVNLLKYFNKCKKWHFKTMIYIVFCFFKFPIKFFLCKGIVNIQFFNFYKLGFLISKYDKV